MCAHRAAQGMRGKGEGRQPWRPSFREQIPEPQRLPDDTYKCRCWPVTLSVLAWPTTAADPAAISLPPYMRTPGQRRQSLAACRRRNGCSQRGLRGTPEDEKARTQGRGLCQHQGIRELHAWRRRRPSCKSCPDIACSPSNSAPWAANPPVLRHDPSGSLEQPCSIAHCSPPSRMGLAALIMVAKH